MQPVTLRPYLLQALRYVSESESDRETKRGLKTRANAHDSARAYLRAWKDPEGDRELVARGDVPARAFMLLRADLLNEAKLSNFDLDNPNTVLSVGDE